MRYLLVTSLVLLFLHGSSQSIPGNGNLLLLDPGRVMLPSINATESAAQQASNWLNLRRSDPKNATAWLNQYIWTERNRELSDQEKKEQLSLSLSEARNYIEGTG